MNGASYAQDADRNLDILRAIAVLAVLVFHSIAPMGGSVDLVSLGHFGVLIFFVHTARVLMSSMERIHGEKWVWRFYLRRVFRLYPLAAFFVFLTLLLRIPPAAMRSFVMPSTGVIAANFLLIQNLWPASDSISIPMWSLPYEVQMYLALPLIFLAVRRFGAQSAKWLLIVSLVLSAVDMCHARPPYLFAYAPCFLSGVLAYASQRKATLPAWMWPCFLVGLYFAYRAIGGWSDWLICMAIGWTLPMFRQFPAGAFASGAGLVARYSYGIYLSHMPLLWICFRWLHAGRVVQLTAFATAIVVVPVIVYHGLERPMIALGRRVSGDGRRRKNREFRTASQSSAEPWFSYTQQGREARI